jgi:glycosyltransferase involved in cell wall biosynthesis
MESRILFVTWDGPQVSYLESLFVPIFERLEARGLQFDVLQFRWGDPALTIRAARRCRDAGIGYRAVVVPRGVPVVGPFVAAVSGSRETRAAVEDFKSDFVMPRSLLPALSVLAAGGSRLRPVIYDADGLEADERADFRGLSPASPVYRMLRIIERRAVRAATSVLVRTNEAADVLAQRSSVERERFHVVTNGRDPSLFRPPIAEERRRTRSELGLPADAPVLVYSGSIGPQYRLDKVGETIAAVRRRSPDARLLVLTSEPSNAIDVLEGHSPGIAQVTTVLSTEPERVSLYLGAADAGLSFRSDAFSTCAIAPVKLGEYLLCGLPVIGTARAAARRLDPEIFFPDSAPLDAAADWLLGTVIPNREALREKARQCGLEHFSLDASLRDYVRAIGAASSVPASETRTTAALSL